MLRGQSVSAGLAVGRAAVLRTAHGWVARVPIAAHRVEAECRRLLAAAEAASRKARVTRRGPLGRDRGGGFRDPVRARADRARP